MRDWLLKRYASSTFNTCPHQQLPRMDGLPVEILLLDDAKPTAYHTAIPVPMHWQEKVYLDLYRHEVLEVIERVPIGETVTWCHRMVVTRKHDGSPRTTVDLSPLNKHCRRQTNNAESPFRVVHRIPRDTWKAVNDAWNDYYSLPLRESECHLTTFITPIGRWRYKREPQGFLLSQDDYNRRFDAILVEFPRKERIVDDTLHYDQNLEKHWWCTIDFLTLVGNEGIVLNPEKLQFTKKEIEFAGFQITKDRIDPLDKYFSTIRDFPTLSSTTDIRSWFGLISEVLNYAQLHQHMTPFRPFLSPCCPFELDETLNAAFSSSKVAIFDAIKSGVKIFDLDCPACMRTDWSKQGIGYFPLQKYCSCPGKVPDCCPDGWWITLAGSRFLSSTEQHYAPIEGEALSISWELEQTNWFTMGCHDLFVSTDHKLLTKVFGNRTLDEISNTRLFQLILAVLTRANCRDCIVNAPSQPAQPSPPTVPFSTPFEKVFADFIHSTAQHYLVVGNRLSGWSDVFTSPHGSPQSGSAGLISCMRNYFARFGVPEEISSNGGPEFVPKATVDFFCR